MIVAWTNATASFGTRRTSSSSSSGARPPLRRSRRAPGRRLASLPLPRPSRALVGRRRLHLKHDEPLPVGRARRALARQSRAGSDDPGDDAVRPRARVVARPPRSRLAAAYTRAEPGDPRRLRTDRRVLAAHVGAHTPIAKKVWLAA